MKSLLWAALLAIAEPTAAQVPSPLTLPRLTEPNRFRRNER